MEVGPVTVDGKPYEMASITVATSSQERTADQITRTSPLPIHLGMLFTLHLTGEQLTQGEHAINVSVLTREIGRIKFDFQDTIA